MPKLIDSLKRSPDYICLHIGNSMLAPVISRNNLENEMYSYRQQSDTLAIMRKISVFIIIVSLVAIAVNTVMLFR